MIEVSDWLDGRFEIDRAFPIPGSPKQAPGTHAQAPSLLLDILSERVDGTRHGMTRNDPARTAATRRAEQNQARAGTTQHHYYCCTEYVYKKEATK
ncbi:hypothetical protein AMEX_G5712 [Astyanax mexicanus]|uniref:Uncharacterized protein n=1 Tax=Astyanax mexicanus TaxID=7994 RepID=A0A8T2M6A7_ASTMX|nr:hypothetical protein AMEX_G5712 [Astyanax mexicanus]